MNSEEFLLHMEIPRDVPKNPNVRVILFHNPYTETQQKIIDVICFNSKQIIGQVIRTAKPDKKIAQEIQRLILSQSEPNMSELQYVILGQQKPKKLMTR